MLFGVYAATAIHLFFLSVVSFLTDDLVQSPVFERSKGFIFHTTKEWRSTIRTQPSLPPYLKKRRDNKSNTMVLPTQGHWGNISQQTHLPPSVESAIQISHAFSTLAEKNRLNLELICINSFMMGSRIHPIIYQSFLTSMNWLIKILLMAYLKNCRRTFWACSSATNRFFE